MALTKNLKETSDEWSLLFQLLSGNSVLNPFWLHSWKKENHMMKETTACAVHRRVFNWWWQILGIDVDKTSRKCCTTERCACFVTLYPHQWETMSERNKARRVEEKQNNFWEEWWLLLLNCQSKFWSSSLLGLLKRKGLKGGLEILYSSVVVEHNQARQPIDHCKCSLGNVQKGLVQEWSDSKVTVRERCPRSANLAKWSALSMLTTSQQSVLIEMFHHKFRISSDWKHV